MVDRDCWGPCCPGCPWMGQPYKPCRECGGAESSDKEARPRPKKGE